MKPPFFPWNQRVPIKNGWIFPKDREIVLAAVTQNGEALSFVGAWQCDEDAARGAEIQRKWTV